MVAQHIAGWLGRNNTKRDCMSGWRSPTASEYRLAPWRRTLRFRKGSFRHQGSCVTELGRLCRRRPLPSALVAAKSPPNPSGTTAATWKVWDISNVVVYADGLCVVVAVTRPAETWNPAPHVVTTLLRVFRAFGMQVNLQSRTTEAFLCLRVHHQKQIPEDHGRGHSARCEWSTRTHTWEACSLRVPTVMRICANAHVHCHWSTPIPQLTVRRLERRHPSNSTCSKTSESVSRGHEGRSTNC